MLLSDFGIVRRYDDSQQSLTRIGWGSAEYAAPEQSLGVLRRSSDIYTLGVLLFSILTGHPPFTGQTPVEVLLKHVRQQAPSARLFEPTISDPVDGVLRRAMQKRSDDRFATAEEFSNALLAAVTVAPIASPVAKAISIPTHQLSSTQSQSSSDPQTPVPAHIALTPPAVMPPSPTNPLSVWSPPGETSHKDSSSTPPNEAPVQPSPLVTHRPGDDEDPLSGVTERQKKSSLLGDEHAGAHTFWTAGPIEWSPLGSQNEGTPPLTADDYLHSKPLVPGVPQAPLAPPTSPAPPATAEPHDDKEQKTSTSRLKKLLPIIVVILLLLGLLGALLSSFFYSSGSPNSGLHQSIPSISSVARVAGARVTAGDSVDNGTYHFWSIEHLYSNQVATGLALSFI